MTMTDPVADMLTRIRNANTAFKDEVDVPRSKVKEEIARVLAREGYVQSFRIEGEAPRERIVVEMKYGPERERTISGLKRVSRPGRGGAG
jgi:small subunit ribosomal protein S8